MPAPRPFTDALDIWCIAQVYRQEPGATIDSALESLAHSHQPLPIELDAPAFDKDDKMVLGDHFSFPHLKRLYKRANKAINANPALASEMHSKVAHLRAAYEEHPGSRFFIQRIWGEDSGTVIAHHCPDIEYVAFYFRLRPGQQIEFRETGDLKDAFEPFARIVRAP